MLGLEGEFDEDLLQLLIDVVDAELLERVVLGSRFSRYMLDAYNDPNLEDLETEDILGPRLKLKFYI